MKFGRAPTTWRTCGEPLRLERWPVVPKSDRYWPAPSKALVCGQGYERLVQNLDRRDRGVSSAPQRLDGKATLGGVALVDVPYPRLLGS